MNTENIKVIIVDDHELFRLGLRTAIENRNTDITVIGEANSGKDFFKLLEISTPDIVLLDIMLPDTNGIEIARSLKNEKPELKILVISGENTVETVQEMLNIGIEGFISKINSNPDIIVEAIRSVIQGFDYFGKDISEIIGRIYIAKKKTAKVTTEFSEQEKQIIELCIEGLPAKLIADRLGLATKTVEWHKSNIFRKLGINSTVEMVSFAVKNSII